MKNEKENIFVFGAGGHAKVVIDVVERQGLYEIAFLVDDDRTMKDTLFYGYRIIGSRIELLSGTVMKGIVAIGCNMARCKVATWLKEHGYELISVVHPSAQLARGTNIGVGTVVMAGAIINSDVIVGENVIVNSKASLDHDCSIGRCSHIAPGAILCGSVTVSDGTFICAGATILPNISVGSNVIVGAGSTVVSDLPDNVTVVGTPARIVKHHQPDLYRGLKCP